MIDNKRYKYTGNIEDNGWGMNLIPCFLCGTRIKYEFELVNENDENDTIKIWCECVKKFDPSLEEIAQTDKGRFLKSQKIENVLNTLVKLSNLDSNFDYNSMMRYFEERWWFTPKQVLLIYKKWLDFCIEIKSSDFKVIIKRDREKEQMNSLNHKEKINITPFLSRIQKEKYSSK